MKIAFFSNFLNLHQLPMCQEFLRIKDVEFTFVACTPIPKERLSMKYEDMNEIYDFVLCSYKNSLFYEQAMNLAKTVDVAIFGSTDLSFLYERMKQNKLTFRYCERALRKGSWRRFLPTTFLKIYNEYLRYRHKNLYILSASAFTSNDLALCGFNADKCYKWGYLPEVKIYDSIDNLLQCKKKNRIIWVGRFIDCKHPEFAIKAAKQLKKAGYDFELQFVGNGELLERSKLYVKKLGLNKEVKFFGALSSIEVRNMMEKSSIFIFNSDRYEGWGAVVNEAMNSACALVVSDEVGSAPFLIDDGVNGFTYRYGDLDIFVDLVANLLQKQKLVQKMGRNAYETMVNKWNVRIAVPRFVKLAEALLNNGGIEFESGPCSKAEIISKYT